MHDHRRPFGRQHIARAAAVLPAQAEELLLGKGYSLALTSGITAVFKTGVIEMDSLFAERVSNRGQAWPFMGKLTTYFVDWSVVWRPANR